MDIKPYSKNAKKHPDKQLKQIANSLKEFGWQQPIVVDKDGVIIVGHGRWFAYQKYPEGIKEPRVETADLTEQQAKAYRLADNKLNESDWDIDLAMSELDSLDKELLIAIDFDKSLFDTGNAFRDLDSLGEDFVPNLNPEHVNKDVTGEDINNKSEELEGRFKEGVDKANDDTVKVCCPECGHDFEIKK